MATSGRRSRRGWIDTDDEMVPFISDRIAETLRHRRMSARQLAGATGDLQQTIDLIVRGKSKKCRRSRLRKIARVLRVPLKWLMVGEQRHLDFVRLGVIVDPTDDTDAWLTTDLPPDYLPPRLEIVVSAFIVECDKALRGDFEKRYGKGWSKEYELWGQDLRRALVYLIAGRWWQQVGMMLPRLSNQENATVHLVGAWELMLEPWFKGRCCPNWKAILQTVQIVAPTRLDYGLLAERVYDLYPELADIRARNEARKKHTMPTQKRTRRTD